MLIALVIIWGVLALVLIGSTALAAGGVMPKFRDSSQEQASIPSSCSLASTGNDSPASEQKDSAEPQINPSQVA